MKYAFCGKFRAKIKAKGYKLGYWSKIKNCLPVVDPPADSILPVLN